MFVGDSRVFHRVLATPLCLPCQAQLGLVLTSSLSRPAVVGSPLQVPPTVDNMLESVVALTAGALGLAPESLCNTHRLDVGTSGIVVLAKNPGWAAWFSGLLSNKPGAVVKTYRYV